jgi:methionine-rich copper-binding protein CopC
MRTKLLAIVAALSFVSAASSAFAHAQLESAAPPVGGTVTSPSEIRLTFSEGVEPKFSGLTLSGTSGAAALGAPTADPGHQNVLVVKIAKALSPGVYTVKWRALSVDTHHTQGTFEFTVK